MSAGHPGIPLSVIVAILPDNSHAGAIVAGLGRQRAERDSFELLLVDTRPRLRDDPGGGLVRAAAAHGYDTRYLPLAGASRAAANNLGVRLSASPVVLFLAHEFMPSPGCIA